jgi:hypothetical protein
MEHPPSLPAPRVIAASLLKKRFPALMADLPDGNQLLQVWAVAVAINDHGHEILLAGCATFGSSDEAQTLVPVPKKVFESWFPLSMLNAIPDGVDGIDSLGPARPERMVPFGGGVATARALDITAAEGYDLADRWVSGRQPVRRTRTFLQRALGVIPGELAGDLTETYQMVLAKDFDEDSMSRIGAMCFAIACLLEGDEQE